MPPDITTHSPVTYAASSEHKKAAAPPISSGTPNLPKGTWERIVSSISEFSWSYKK